MIAPLCERVKAPRIKHRSYTNAEKKELIEFLMKESVNGEGKEWKNGKDATFLQARGQFRIVSKTTVYDIWNDRDRFMVAQQEAVQNRMKGKFDRKRLVMFYLCKHYLFKQ